MCWLLTEFKKQHPSIDPLMAYTLGEIEIPALAPRGVWRSYGSSPGDTSGLGIGPVNTVTDQGLDCLALVWWKVTVKLTLWMNL